MARSHQIVVDGKSLLAQDGELLLDAALRNGVDLPFDCRAGHCGTCCVRLISGEVKGGEGSEAGIVHACQCRIVGKAIVQRDQPTAVRSVAGVLGSLRRLSSDVWEVGIETDRALPHYGGQYAKVRFSGFPSRPFSITHPVLDSPGKCSSWFHIRLNRNGRVTSSLGAGIRPGHFVEMTGPFGSAHFKPNQNSRLVLIATNTGFAPIWSIAIAALRENPNRLVMIIIGARTMEGLYMAPAVAQLCRFPNVLVVPVCSTPQSMSRAVRFGRPTDYMPRLQSTDALYACGAPAMVAAIQAMAAHAGAVCHADPFIPPVDDVEEATLLDRAARLVTFPHIRNLTKTILNGQGDQSELGQGRRVAVARVKHQHRS